MNIISERILADCGFILNSQKAHASEFKHKGIVVYIVPSAQLNLVISPEDYLYLKDLGFKKYHNSNLTAFPKESNEGKQEIHYGYKKEFEDSSSMKQFLIEYTSYKNG